DSPTRECKIRSVDIKATETCRLLPGCHGLLKRLVDIGGQLPSSHIQQDELIEVSPFFLLFHVSEQGTNIPQSTLSRLRSSSGPESDNLALEILIVILPGHELRKSNAREKVEEMAKSQKQN
uniref:HPS3_C domain-containing protein n=1 Tax=Haemonchus contortus TaxID=6289 RepID=A0A7I4YF02_HAECO